MQCVRYKIVTCRLRLRAAFYTGVRANVQPKSSIPIGAKVEISPKLCTRSQG
jgi:hypothetical protein